MNRKKRKAIKMARKQKRDIYTARNPEWQSRRFLDGPSRPLDAEVMRRVFEACR